MKNRQTLKVDKREKERHTFYLSNIIILEIGGVEYQLVNKSNHDFGWCEDPNLHDFYW